MKKQRYLDSIVLVLVLCGLHLSYAARQNPLKNPKICGRPVCEVETSKFGFSDTNRYKYDYNVHLRTEFSGTGQNSSDVYVRAVVELIFPKHCEGVLTLNYVQLREKIQEEIVKPTESSTFVDYYDYDNLETSPEGEAEVNDINLHPKSNDLSVDLQKYDLRFSFQDGVISEVCPHVEEPSWVLNFKKGILSSIQNTMLRFDVDLNTTETDVSGRCNVAYSLEGTDNAYVLIKKTKDIRSCRFRQSTHSVLQTTPYVFRDDKAIWPILNSHSYCNMTIDHSIYRDVSCFERHQLIPFSNNHTGAVTTAHSTLKLSSEEQYSSGDFYLYQDEHPIEKRSTLLFDHTPATKPTHGEIKASRDLLKQMCNLGFPDIQREFIDVFTNFLQTTKHLEYKALTQLLARSESICSNGKNHVLESLPYVGSTASYQLMRDQIISNTIPKQLAHSWMASLSFIQRPDEETLETFYTILEFSKKKIDAEYTLASTAVVYSFCRHNADCVSNKRVTKIIRLLETEFLSLFNMYRNERRTHDRLMVILKGLGNIGVLSEPFAEQLKEIITEGIAPVDIRLQSVLAFRRVDCMKYREFFLETYGNLTINSEIRIFSYVQAMRCPTYQSIDFVKEVLRREQINQVGSYVWSHLTNLAKSSSPVRVECQGLLINDDLSEKFKLDIRKFSRNYEHSLFFDEYNFGTSTDMNLIFGTDSYLPRMATLNFTADLFGQSVNFFEISARAEGFEELASSIFGPKGPLNRELFRKKFAFLTKWLGEKAALNEESLENLLDFDPLRIKRSAEVGVTEESTGDNEDDDYDFEEDEEKPRSTRSVDRKESIQRSIDDLGYKLKYNYNNPKATFGLRIFGNDLRFHSVEGLAEVMAVAKELDPFHQAAKILSGNEVTYTKSSVLLDASYNVPLAIGLPLSIHAFGASSVDLRLSGSLDRMRDASDYWHFDIDGKLKTSVSVDVITTMQTDAFYALSGIRVKSNLYSNSAIEAKLKIRGASLVSLKFSLPQDKNEIFSARSELVVMKESEEIPQFGIEHRSSNNTCTWPILDQAIGLKVCSSFSVPDLSNASDATYPGLLLSGPVNMSWVLEKSDPSAKLFVFEYEWQQVKNDSKWSFIFTTPDSAVKRLLTANVSTVPAAGNVSVWFINGANTYSAGGVYRGDPDDRRLDVYIDTNGRKNLDLHVEMKRYQDRNSWVYKPKALLSINGENITGLVGLVRINEKNGISQNDVELTFETKKLQVLIKGNVVKSEITTSTNMTVNYRFQANQIETVQFEGKISNTGDKSKAEYGANVKLRTSAYPKLNFASNATWLSLQGHTEGVVTYNNAPDAIDPSRTSRLRLVFARSHSEDYAWEGSRTRASLELTVPKSNIDFRLLVKHEERIKNGTEHNVVIGLKYAPQKEATGVFSVHLPRRNLFAVDAYMNVTVPEFNSCTVRLRVNEKSKQDYMINFNGTWFSSHSISIKGNYRDKSSRVQVLHHLKLLVESPSFEVTSFNLIFRRNQLLVFADVQAKYNKDPYGLTLQYNSNENKTNSNAEVKLKVKEKDYSLAANLLSQQPKLLQIEIHMDKLRDIHLKVGVLTVPKRKELSVEIKWDANRDPSQRLAINAEYNNPANRTYDATLMFTYPDRTFSCGFNMYAGGPKYFGAARATWGTNDVVLFNYDAGFIPGKEFNNWIRAELSTPFEGWSKNSLSAGVYNHENRFLVNSSLLWADSQRLQLGYESDHEISEPLLSFHIGLGINSTIKDIPTVTVKVKHWQDLKKFDSELDLRYNDVNETLKIYSVKSVWELAKTDGYRNISGSVLMLSPFEGYRKGGLATKLSLSDDRRIQGAASLNFDMREFTLAMDGYVKKFTDNMLVINITTPLEKFRTINSRFGLSEKKRHAVAEVRSPAMAFGAEVLLAVNAFSDFDVILSLATPIENLRQIAFIGKVKATTVDVRGSLNNSTLGFTGVWTFHNLTDFEYSYVVYTPFVGFEENGFVVKLIKRDVFILEVHGKLSKHKLGVKVNGKPKSKLLNIISPNKLDLELLYDEDLKAPERPVDADDYDEEEYDVNEYFTYFVDMQLDTLTWPTITGQVDIQEVEDFYIIVGEAFLPAGRIDFKDRLYYPDMLNVKNVLNLYTPFDVCRNLKSIFEYHIDLDRFFIERVEFVVDNGVAAPTEFGFVVNYTKLVEDKEIKQHDLALMVKTPFEILKEIEIEAFLELEENIHRGNISSRTATTMLSMAASVEAEDNFLETSVGVILNTDAIPHYACKGYFKKEFSDADNSVDIQFEVHDNGVQNKLQIASGWQLSAANVINARGKVLTTMLPLKVAETSILLTKGPNPALNFDLALVNRNGQRIEYGSRASKNKDVFNVEVWTPLKNYRNISMHGTLTRNQAKPSEYLVNGHLYRNMAVYTVSGSVQMADTYPARTMLRVQPKAGGPDGVIELTIKASDRGTNFQFSAAEDAKMCEISGGYSVRNKLDWDFDVLVQSSEPDLSRISVNGNIRPQADGQFTGELGLQTPWRHLGIESVRLTSHINVQKDSGNVQGEYLIGRTTGRGSCAWSWIVAQNMQLALESYIERENGQPRVVHASAKYVNPNKSFKRLLTGGKLNFDSKWILEVNGTLAYLSGNDVQGGLVVKLPTPIGDVHQLGARYRGNLMTKEPINVFFEGKYESQEAKNRFLTRGSYRNVDDLQGLCRIQWGRASNVSTVEGDFQVLRKKEVRKEFYAKLITPKFDEDTVFVRGHYDKDKDFHQLMCTLDFPASRRLGDVDVAFNSLSNMNGHLNGTVPFFNITWLRGDFNFSTTGGQSIRYIKGTWPTDSGFFNLNSSYSSHNLNRDLQGTIQVEVPLTSRHRANIDYGLKERELMNTGHANVVYNDKNVLSGRYNSKTEQSMGFEKDIIDISLENELKPLGIHYVHEKHYTNAEFPDHDMKHCELFELRNSKAFNLTGELHVRSTETGQDFKIVAIHPNRTIILDSEYDYKDSRSKHKSKLQLAPTAWIGYNFEIGNYTTANNESQNFVFELSYPRRNLSAEGWYFVTEERFDSDISFKWNISPGSEERKTVRASLLWQSELLAQGDKDNQSVVFSIGHPYLEKDVEFKGSYYRGREDLLKTSLLINYSEDPDHLVTLKTQLRDLASAGGFTNYTLDFVVLHPASTLDVNVHGTAAGRTSYYRTKSTAHYRRGYYPEKKGMFLAKLDLNNKEFEYERISPYRQIRFWAIPYLRYPLYGLNATVWDSPDLNNTGFVYVDLGSKFIRAEFNLSEDASQNLQMIGHIPDARSGFLDIWRNYEEIRIVDVSSYLNINHSRLITGRFHWRPTIKEEIKAKFQTIGKSFYTSFSDGIDFWINDLYSESMDSVNDIWGAAKIHTQSFLDDVGELSVLEQDLEELRVFVNQSYEANDFYIKTVVNFTLSVLDELAIRDHIESLPKIFTELWHAMGDSGKALRKNIMWLIETVKTSYHKALEAIGKFFHGDSLHYLSDLLKKGVEKYDKFIKDLHISFIKYVQNLWNNFSTMMSNYWKSVLKRIEPHVFRFLSYIETAAWDISKEVFDFIYKRTNELAESPYFNKVSSFTQDVDRLYKDVKSNDALTNIKKYSMIAWNFIKEKYFKLVPFGKELNEVFTEIWEEIKDLQKLDHIQVIIQKTNEILAKIEWLADELQFETRLHQLYALLRNKFRNYALNALETADMYREAKTKFIFDPEAGVIDLEQKLPMSWHAFNETPKFEEIPEYKFLANAQNFFSSTNASIVKYIYSFKSHLDPNTWLPPYTQRSLLIGSRHYMTFDQSFVGLNLQFEEGKEPHCTYLLAHDFFQRNFSLLLEPSTSTKESLVSTKKLTLVADNQVLEVDLEEDTLTVDGNTSPMLPLQFGAVTIYREMDILTIQSDKDFSLNCNIQFDLCWFEVSGWYYGQTAGILGTVNNERFDEFMTSRNAVVDDGEEFTDSWSFQSCKQKKASTKRKVSSEVIKTCEHFFKSGMLSACTDTIDPEPFIEMCNDLGANSNPMADSNLAIKGICTAALAYIEACAAAKILMRVPEQCVYCKLLNGTYVPEGTFTTLKKEDIPRSADIVFIVEAKPCNANLTLKKSIMTVVGSLEEELAAAKLSNNRFAVLAFGGHEPFDLPHSIVHHNQVFTSNTNELRKYFDHIKVANGTNNDILQAISAATHLKFRPAASKILILLSCSDCASHHMKFDFTSILQYMLEEGVNLHILADTEFDFEKTRKLRHFFGLDRDFVFSKRFLDGDAETRKQLHIPKNNLGLCTPLALETNGSVFTARKLQPERRYPIKRFAGIFAKRVAKTAAPNACQRCECTGHNTGVAYISCTPCSLPTHSSVEDYDFQFNDWDWDDEQIEEEI